VRGRRVRLRGEDRVPVHVPYPGDVLQLRSRLDPTRAHRARVHRGPGPLGRQLHLRYLAGYLHTTTDGTDSISLVTATLNKVAHTTWYASKNISYPVPSSQLNLLRSDVLYDITRNYVIVANVIGSEKDDAGVTHSYSGGHYLTVVGEYNNGNTVYIEDVAISASGTHMYSMSVAALADWIANRGYSA
jgi:hypothetical protein